MLNNYYFYLEGCSWKILKCVFIRVLRINGYAVLFVYNGVKWEYAECVRGGKCFGAVIRNFEVV